MKTRHFLAGIMLAALFLPAGLTLAQAGPGNGACRNSAFNQPYDPSTVETLTGVVRAVEHVASESGPCVGVHLAVDVNGERLAVHLGPSWFIDNQDQTFAVGDDIVIVGARIVKDGMPAVIAATVKRGDQELKLRDDAGFPVWRGWRRGQRLNG
ncbi:MAG: hypothetical protein R2834_01995 [Rhodothermales bacterium]